MELYATWNMYGVLLLVVAISGAATVAVPTIGDRGSKYTSHPPPLAYWNFNERDPFVDVVSGYRLMQANKSEPVPIIPGAGRPGTNGGAAEFRHRRQRLYAPRASVPALANISGPHAQVSVIAWVELLDSMPLHGGAFVGGLWQEADSWRQYAIFLDGTGGCPTHNGLVGHISAEGGPSPNQEYCRSRACGATALLDNALHCLATTYDGHFIRAYVNGSLDSTKSHADADNPFAYPNPPHFPNGGIFDDGHADLALGANIIKIPPVTGPRVLGNAFTGRIAGFAVHNVTLTAENIAEICGGRSRVYAALDQ